MPKPEPKQERTKEDLEIIYQMLYYKYNNLGIGIPKLEEIHTEIKDRRKKRNRRTQLEIYGTEGYKTRNRE